MANHPAFHYPDIGVLGEDLVARWLQSSGWTILHRRWRCRWGELDLVAKLDWREGMGTGDKGMGGQGDNSQFTIHNSQFTIHNSQFTIHNSTHPTPDYAALMPRIPPPPPASPLPTPLLAFVEVKTRKQNNWDAGGLLAITPQKQRRLWQAAECFLSAYPDLTAYQCRFDVALVQHRKLSLAQLRQASHTLDISPDLSSLSVQLGQAVIVTGYQLVLQEYLPAAFG